MLLISAVPQQRPKVCLSLAEVAVAALGCEGLCPAVLAWVLWGFVQNSLQPADASVGHCFVYINLPVRSYVQRAGGGRNMLG